MYIYMVYLGEETINPESESVNAVRGIGHHSDELGEDQNW